MAMFWLISIVLVTAALVPFLWSQFTARHQPGWTTQAALNRSLYYRQLEELQRADEEGLVEEQQVLACELQQRLLQDIPEEPLPSPATRSTRGVALWIGALVVAGSVALYWWLGAHKQVAKWLDVSQRLPEISRKVMAGDQPLSAADIQDFALALRTRLAASPEDARGWYLLGRLGMSQQQPSMALDALRRAYRLSPDDPQIVTTYAQLLALSGDHLLQQQAQALIGRLLEAHPDNLDGWSLYAFMAYEQKDYPLAVARWQQLLERLDPADARYQTVLQTIAVIRSKIADSEPVSTGPSYTVTVTLGEGIDVPRKGFLFVFAQQVNGPPMPLAAKKLPLSSFPVTLSLSDADAMMPQFKLSQQSRFVVTARISEDENVASAPGEWQGSSAVIDAGGTGRPIEIVIDSHL